MSDLVVVLKYKTLHKRCTWTLLFYRLEYAYLRHDARKAFEVGQYRFVGLEAEIDEPIHP